MGIVLTNKPMLGNWASRGLPLHSRHWGCKDLGCTLVFQCTTPLCNWWGRCRYILCLSLRIPFPSNLCLSTSTSVSPSLCLSSNLFHFCLCLCLPVFIYLFLSLFLSLYLPVYLCLPLIHKYLYPSQNKKRKTTLPDFSVDAEPFVFVPLPQARFITRQEWSWGFPLHRKAFYRDKHPRKP